jgi:hypothetical protein
MTVALSAVFVAVLTYSPSCPAAALSSDQRFEKQAAKGVELYSWKERDGSLRFSLLWGTNRNKTDREIKTPRCTLKDIAALKAALGRLAKLEQVFWANELCPKTDCTYPSDDVLDILRAHAKNVDVTLAPRWSGPLK